MDELLSKLKEMNSHFSIFWKSSPRNKKNDNVFNVGLLDVCNTHCVFSCIIIQYKTEKYMFYHLGHNTHHCLLLRINWSCSLSLFLQAAHSFCTNLIARSTHWFAVSWIHDFCFQWLSYEFQRFSVRFEYFWQIQEIIYIVHLIVHE